MQIDHSRSGDDPLPAVGRGLPTSISAIHSDATLVASAGTTPTGNNASQCLTSKLPESLTVPRNLDRSVVELPIAEAKKGELPILKHRNAIEQAIARNTITGIAAHTGTGKSSRVPLFLLERSLALQGAPTPVDLDLHPIPWESKIPVNIYSSIPTRVAATKLASYVAETLMGSKVGDTIGYRIGGGSKKASPNTRLSFCTAGWLVSALLHGIKLTKPSELLEKSDFTLFETPVTHVIIDEVHVRSVEVDILLLLMKLITTEYLDLRIDFIEDLIEEFEEVAVVADAEAVQDQWRKLVSDIHDVFANRTRWVIMSATGNIDEIFGSYLKETTQRFETQVMDFLQSGYAVFDQAKLQRLKEELFSISISRLPEKVRNRYTLEKVDNSLGFDCSPVNIMGKQKPSLLQLKAKSYPAKEYFLEDLQDEFGKNFEPVLINLILPFMSKPMGNNEVSFLLNQTVPPLTKLAVKLCLKLIEKKDCDSIIIFASGIEDIQQIMYEFEAAHKKRLDPFLDIGDDMEQLPAAATDKYVLLPLHGQFESVDLQHAVDLDTKALGNRKKIYIATNVAETSLTIPDLDVVVDLGHRKEARFDYKGRKDVIHRNWTSRPSAIQRAGRVGRCKPGKVFRLYTQTRFNELAEFDDPAILTTKLDSLVLQVLKGTSSSPINDLVQRLEDVPPEHGLLSLLMNPPDKVDVQRTLDYLYLEECITEPNFETAKVTNRGKSLTVCPFDPLSSHILSLGNLLNMLPEAIVLAASLASKDIFVRPNPNNSKPEYLRWLRYNTEGIVRAGIANGGGDTFLFSDLLSRFNVFTQAMQFKHNLSWKNKNSRRKTLNSYGVHPRRFENFRIRTKGLVKTALHSFYDAQIEELQDDEADTQRHEVFQSEKFDRLGLLLKATLTSADVNTLFSFDIAKYRVLLFLFFYKNFAIKSDNKPPTFSISNNKGSIEDFSKDLGLVNRGFGIKVFSNPGKQGIFLTPAGDKCHETRTMDSRIQSILFRNRNNWKSNLATYNISHGLFNQTNLPTYDLLGLKHSNPKFFELPNANHIASDTNNITNYRALPTLHSTLQWSMYRAVSDERRATSNDDNNVHVTENQRQCLDKVVTEKVTIRTANLSPCSVTFGPEDERLFAVVTDPVDVSRDDTNQVIVTETLNVITSCEKTLALYFFCFINPLKVRLHCPNGEIQLYWDDMAETWKRNVPSASDNNQVSEVTISTLYYSLCLKTNGLTLGVFRDLLPLRLKFREMMTKITDGKESGEKNHAPFVEILRKIDQHVTMARKN